MKYEGPILLENVSVNDNTWASASDMSEYFYDELPAYKVDKANIVRAVAYNRKGEAGEVISGTYFIGLPKEKYENIAVISLIADPDDLWGYEKGIYVKGISQELYPEGTDSGLVAPTEYSANYNMRGKEWERECDTEWFFPETDEVMQQTVGIRVKGNYSRSFAQKSFNLFAREEYGKNKFNYDFWNDNDKLVEESSITLFAGGYSDKATKLKDALIGELVGDLEVTVSKARPCVVFLDGEYWGFYQIMQRVKADYLEDHYDIPSGNLTFVETGKNVIVEGHEELYEELLTYVKINDMSSEEAYDGICEMIDMQSFMDYFAVNIYIHNKDWPDNNMLMWRSNQKGQRTYEDTKWRWIVHDVNTSKCMDHERVDADTTENARDDEVFTALLENAEFRQAFYDNFVRISEEVFEPGHVCEILFRKAEEIKPYMEEDYERFPNQYTIGEDFVENVQNVADFFRERSAYIIPYVQRMMEEYE